MNKKQADDKLQELRSRNNENKIRYLKRMQEEKEADEEVTRQLYNHGDYE